jgi:hypothetical protein
MHRSSLSGGLLFFPAPNPCSESCVARSSPLLYLRVCVRARKCLIPTLRLRARSPALLGQFEAKPPGVNRSHDSRVATCFGWRSGALCHYDLLLGHV